MERTKESTAIEIKSLREEQRKLKKCKEIYAGEGTVEQDCQSLHEIIEDRINILLSL